MAEKLVAQVNVSGFDGQFAPLGHRVARIDHQVHDYLFQATGIGCHRIVGGGRNGHQFNVFPDEPPQHLFDLDDQVVQMHRARNHGLPPAKGEQLVGQAATAFGRAPDLFQRGALGVLQVTAGQQQVAVPRDDGEQIVKIVRYTAGEAADGFHLLCLVELLFQADAVAAQLGGADLALYRRVQPHQVAAGHVVGCPGLQGGKDVSILDLPGRLR